MQLAERTHSETDSRPQRGRPRDESKNIAILEAASELFMSKGFDGTNMGDVAKNAGVSKQTVYSHFSSKEQLFSAAITAKIEDYLPEMALEAVQNHTVEADLTAVCESLARLVFSPEAIQMHRVLVQAAHKGPELAEIFWKAGPRMMIDRMKAFLQSWVDRGALYIEDIELAAVNLGALIHGNLQSQLAIGLIDEVSDEQIKEHVRFCVTGFLLVYKKK